MESFSIYLELQGFTGSALGGYAPSASTPFDGKAYLAPDAFVHYRDPTLSADRRQSLDVEIPGSRLHYIAVLIEDVKVRIDTSKIVAYDPTNHHTPIVYSLKSLNESFKYNNEEVETFLLPLGILVQTRGYAFLSERQRPGNSTKDPTVLSYYTKDLPHNQIYDLLEDRNEFMRFMKADLSKLRVLNGFAFDASKVETLVKQMESYHLRSGGMARAGDFYKKFLQPHIGHVMTSNKLGKITDRY